MNLPICISLGAFAFVPLGPRYLGVGVFAGLASIVLVQTFSMLFGANSAAISGIKTAQTFIIATAIGHLMSLGLVDPAGTPLEALGLIFFVLALAGLIQALYAAAGLGALISYVPYPVVAGFQRGCCELFTSAGRNSSHPVLRAPCKLSWLDGILGGATRTGFRLNGQ